jgi:hypothetical protein
MKITKKQLTFYSELVNSSARKERRSLYWKMYQALNGGLYSLLKEAIMAEFKNPDAVQELLGRLVPINILKKVIIKLAAVYVEAPVRAPVDEDSDDDCELLEDYEDITKFNIRQKQANRYLELFKKNLKEIFTSDKDKKVYIKNLAPYSFEVFNVENPDKSQPDIVCKIVVDSDDLKQQVLHWYSDESFWVTNGAGEVIDSIMALNNNPTGKNPAKTLPFVYKCKSTDSVDPIMDDSLYRVSIAIPIVLTDLFFACKYQCWSMIYTIGVKGEINRNPSSIIALEFSDTSVDGGKDPVIGSIDPKVDSDKVIKMVEATLNLFLSSLGLSGGTLSLGTSASDVVSGVSKILDNAEVIEGKKDQQDDMLDDENMTWDKIKQLIPYWRRNQMLMDDINREFSKLFRVSVSFKEPKPMLSDKDALDMTDKKIKMKMTTWTRELKAMYPDYTDQQVEDLKQEILDEMELYPEVYLGPVAMAMQDGGDPNATLKPGDKKPGEKKSGVQSKVPGQSK